MMMENALKLLLHCFRKERAFDDKVNGIESESNIVIREEKCSDKY